MVLVLFLASGCATAWRGTGSVHYRSVPVRLSAGSTPPDARAFLDGRYLGTTPVITTQPCQQEVTTQTRRVSHWMTQRGLAAPFSIASLGLYLPFSLIPVDTEFRDEPTSTFKPRAFSVRIDKHGYHAWIIHVACGNEGSTVVRHVLDTM